MSTFKGIQETEDIAMYLKKLLRVELGEKEDVEMPELQLDFLEELQYAVKVIAEAMRNQSL